MRWVYKRPGPLRRKFVPKLRGTPTPALGPAPRAVAAVAERVAAAQRFRGGARHAGAPPSPGVAVLAPVPTVHVHGVTVGGRGHVAGVVAPGAATVTSHAPAPPGHPVSIGTRSAANHTPPPNFWFVLARNRLKVRLLLQPERNPLPPGEQEETPTVTVFASALGSNAFAGSLAGDNALAGSQRGSS